MKLIGDRPSSRCVRQQDDGWSNEGVEAAVSIRFPTQGNLQRSHKETPRGGRPPVVSPQQSYTWKISAPTPDRRIYLHTVSFAAKKISWPKSKMGQNQP